MIVQLTVIGGSPTEYPENPEIHAKVGDQVLAFVRSTELTWNDEDGQREIFQLNNVPGNALLVRQPDELYHPLFPVDQPLSVDSVKQAITSQ
jgi:hypothetical protein